MYLKGTRYMKMYLTADNLSNIIWWVDGSFGVHWDSKGHTGGNAVYMERRHGDHRKKTQDECGEFNRTRTGKYHQCSGYDFMVEIFHGSAGVHDQEQYPVPR